MRQFATDACDIHFLNLYALAEIFLHISDYKIAFYLGNTKHSAIFCILNTFVEMYFRM